MNKSCFGLFCEGAQIVCLHMVHRLALVPRAVYFILVALMCWAAPVVCGIRNIFTGAYTRGTLLDQVCGYIRKLLGIIHSHPVYDPASRIVLANHRSMFDPVICQEGTNTVSRGMYAVLIGPLSLCALWCRQMILISRGRTDRHQLWSLISHHRGGLPVLVYPEGTRCRHMHLPDDPGDVVLKPGIIKMIFENNLKFQIYIHCGVDNVLDASTWQMHRGVRIHDHLADVFDPAQWKEDHAGAGFDQFFFDVKLAWHNSWYEVYDAPM